MKSFNSFLSSLFFMSIAFVACDQREFEIPPIDEPVYSDTATMTIADFKTKYASSTVEQITDSITISGIVIANDVSGNFYKEITIMDSTAGLKIAISQSDLYTDYRVGQRVFIECKDLYVGKYSGYMQLGGIYNSAIGQMTWETAEAHIFKDGFPDQTSELLTPEVISIDEVSAAANLGKLVTLENVTFATGGTEICAAAADDGSTQTLSKTLNSSNSSGSITVRLSSAADFANKTLPAGNGNLTGIVTVYGTTYQFTPRDSMDFAFVGFGAGFEPHGTGTTTDPFNVDYALTHQTNETSAWVSGYIVGCVSGSVNSTNLINGSEDILWSSPFLNNTVLIASDSLETDWTKCLVVNLPSGSALRESVNLLTTPQNLRKKLAVTGLFESYLGAGGVTVSTGATSEYWLNHSPIIFSEDFSGSLGDFAAYSVSGTQVWASSSYSGTYFAKMSGYASYVSYANEDWLISPAIALTDVENAVVTFTHANYYKSVSTISEENTLWISSDYVTGSAPSTATWTQLTIPNYQSAYSSYTFLSSGDIQIPAAFLGKNVRIAFKYTSTTSATSTWEVYGFAVNNRD
jgi:hypothetical protein